MSKLDSALTLKNQEINDKDTEVQNLSNKLDLALTDKIGELAEYRSEFFGKLKEVIGNPTKTQGTPRKSKEIQ